MTTSYWFWVPVAVVGWLIVGACVAVVICQVLALTSDDSKGVSNDPD